MIGLIQKNIKSLDWNDLLSVEIWCSMNSSLYNTARKFGWSIFFIFPVAIGPVGPLCSSVDDQKTCSKFFLHRFDITFFAFCARSSSSLSLMVVWMCVKNLFGKFWKKSPQLNHCYSKVRDKLQVICSVSTYQGYNDKCSARLAWYYIHQVA